MKPMNCLIYTRVSSDEQVSNFSLDTQDEICRNYAKQQGYEVLQVFREEGASAKTLIRPKLIELLDYARKNKSNVVSVVAYRIDRIARETSDYLAVRKKLLECGIKLESATEPTGDSPTDKFIETILAASAELDNSIKAEKSRNGLRKRFEAGLVNTPPVGYIANKTNSKGGCLPDPKMFTQMKEAWELMGTGTKTLSEIAEIMNDWGIRTNYRKRLNKLNQQAVSKIFKNPYYYGMIKSYKYNQEIKGIHKPMITEELFFRVQSIISGRRNSAINAKHLVSNPEFPLRGLIKCSCGQSLVAGNVKGRSGKHYAFYWCPKRHGGKSISSTNLDNMLVASLRKLQPSQGAINLFTIALGIEYNATLEQINKNKRLAEMEQIEQKQLMVLLVEGHLKGRYSDDIFDEQKAKIENKILGANIGKNENIIDQYSIEGIIAFTKALLFDLGKAYQVSDYGQKRVLLGSIYPAGLVYDKGQLLNQQLSPLIRQIKASSKPNNLSCARDRT